MSRRLKSYQLARRPQLWIIDNIVPINRINSEWQLIIPILSQIWYSSDYKVNVVRIENNVHKYDYAEMVKYQAAINAKLFTEINRIIEKDIVIFTDARTAMIHNVYEYFILKGIRPYLIGIWNDGYYNSTSLIRKVYDKRHLSYAPTEYERTIAKTFDLNILGTQEHASHFKIAGMYKSKVIKFPFKLLKDVYRLNSFSEFLSDKTDLVIYNPEDTFGHEDIMTPHYNILKTEIPELDFFDISEIKTHDIVKTMPLLSKAKVLISFNGANVSPVQIYHAAILGIVTITPETSYLIDAGYPKELLLNKTEISHKKLYRYIRYIVEVKQKIKLIVDNHQKYLDEIIETLDPMFEATEFLKLIEKIKYVKQSGKQLVGREVPPDVD